jgi:bifunctional enzyme CysN/CysC
MWPTATSPHPSESSSSPTRRDIQYTRNMVTGASTADVVMLLVDARNGILEQTRRHAFLASLLGVPHLVLCVNKMDLVDWTSRSTTPSPTSSGSSPPSCRSPISASCRSPRSKATTSSTLEADGLVPGTVGAGRAGGDPRRIGSESRRLPVPGAVRDPAAHDGTPGLSGYAGQIAGGTWRVGDEVVALPSGFTSRIAAIDTPDGPVDEAVPPMSVTLRLEDEIDISRGDMICRPHNRPHVEQDVEAMVCWMTPTPTLRPDRSWRSSTPPGGAGRWSRTCSTAST